MPDENDDLPSAGDLLGLPIRPFDLDGLVETIVRRARDGRRTFGCYANAHTVNLACADSEFHRVLCACDVLYADGGSIVWATRRDAVPIPCRITAMDYAPVLLRRCAEEGLGVFLLGGRPGIADEAAKHLIREYPGLRVVGTHHGHFGLEKSDDLTAQINEARPAILLAGMSSPRQEFWLAERNGKIQAPVRWCVGALFDYLAGHERRAPRWMCRIGCEWVFRLAMDPIGKWRRYLIGNPRFVWNVIRRRGKIRRRVGKDA